jgi:predicted RNA methylase
MSAFNRLHELRMENDAVRYSMDEQRTRFERMRNRHANGTASRAVVVHQLFQTPVGIVSRMMGLVGDLAGARVLEPSAGLGRLLDGVAAMRPHSVTAVEIDPKCAGELYRQDRDRVKILQRDFLSVSPDETGLFDAVIMNPPFTMRSDIRHIEHALKFVNTGGVLVALCMDTRHRVEALKDRSDHWEQIPAGAFKESGTGIATVMLRITNKKDTQ